MSTLVEGCPWLNGECIARAGLFGLELEKDTATRIDWGVQYSLAQLSADVPMQAMMTREGDHRQIAVARKRTSEQGASKRRENAAARRIGLHHPISGQADRTVVVFVYIIVFMGQQLFALWAGANAWV
ncbi:hypothetical protein [Paracoccus xiamenensis]|uniref:hypothetical protein n=1 Tax=Paracoccus xiamenensis TaxID=2714901 RepID=UPI001409BEE9|nr:hypothetical protein [Paracoccus xiamenensis]NHF74248.1 hypothetical protein [Paracoccus xiamenensis]